MISKIFFSTVTLFSLSAFAQEDLRQMSFDQLEIINQGIVLPSIGDQGLTYIGRPSANDDGSIIPTGEHFKNPDNDCSADKIESVIKNFEGTNNQLSRHISKWTKLCAPQLTNYTALGAVLRFSMIKYPIHLNTKIHYVKFKLRNGLYVQGLLGIKDLNTPRPLIIIKCGLYCDADDSASIKNAFMHLFDEGPFNVLVLSSSSGRHFSFDNHSVAFGGFIEGDQIIQVAEILTSERSSLKGLISGIHINGISLGGNAALMASVYASHNPHIPIKSVVASCPVVSLKPTMNSIFKNNLRGAYFRLETTGHIKAVYNQLPGLKKYLSKKNDFSWSQSKIFNALSRSSFDFHKEITRARPWTTPPFSGVVVTDPEQLWNLNDFTNFTDQVTIPTTVLYSSDDYFVLDKFNARPLKRKLAQSPNPNIGVLDVRRGNHCGFSMGIGWSIYSKMINGLFMKYDDSNKYRADNIIQVTDRSSTWRQDGGRKVRRLYREDVVIKSSWRVDLKQKVAKLITYVFNPFNRRARARDTGRSQCRQYQSQPFNVPAKCLDKIITSIPLRSLASLNVNQVNSKFEANRLTRWLNTSTKITNRNFNTIRGGNSLPQNLHFTREYEF